MSKKYFHWERIILIMIPLTLLLAWPAMAATMKFQVPIPGLAKSIDISGDTIGTYIKAVYKFGVSVLGILAVVMIMVAGFQWLTAAGESGKIKEAKERMSYAVAGLILGLGSYMILRTVNVKLVEFKTLSVARITKQEIPASCFSAADGITCGTQFDVDKQGKITKKSGGACVGTCCSKFDEKCDTDDKSCTSECTDVGGTQSSAANCCSGIIGGGSCVSGRFGSVCKDAGTSRAVCLEGKCVGKGSAGMDICAAGKLFNWCTDDSECEGGYCQKGTDPWFCVPGTEFSFCQDSIIKSQKSGCASGLECFSMFLLTTPACLEPGSDMAAIQAKEEEFRNLKQSGQLPEGAKCDNNDNCASKICSQARFSASYNVAICSSGEEGVGCWTKADCQPGLVCTSSPSGGQSQHKFCRQGKEGDPCDTENGSNQCQSGLSCKKNAYGFLRCVLPGGMRKCQ